VFDSLSCFFLCYYHVNVSGQISCSDKCSHTSKFKLYLARTNPRSTLNCKKSVDMIQWIAVLYPVGHPASVMVA
jgi:hypothetical protein